MSKFIGKVARRLWAAFRFLWSWLPLIGGLSHSPLSSHWKTLKEFFIILPCATLTFWLGPFFLLALTTNTPYKTLVLSTMQQGELLIFSVGFMGPILNLAFEPGSDGKPFPGSKWHIAFLLLAVTMAIGVYAIMRAGQTAHPSFAVNTSFVFTISIGIAIFAVALRYLAMVYRNTSVTEKDITGSASEFTAAFQSQHSGERT